MKKGASFVLVIGSFLLLSATSKPPKPKPCQVPEGEFVIYGELQNVPDSSVLELLRADGRIHRLIDSDTVINGKFIFRDTITDSQARKLRLTARSKGFPNTFLNIWVKSGTYVKITGNDCLHSLWHVESDVPEQHDENLFSEVALAERKQMLTYVTEWNDVYSTGLQQGLDKPTLRKVDSLLKLFLPLVDSIALHELNYMKESPVTTVWLDRYQNYAGYLQWNKKFGHEDLIRSLYDRMPEADRATAAGQLIAAYLNLPEVVSVGDQMVDGDLYDVKGNLHHLSEFKGKYILLDFWSQGCGPCLQSFPEIKEVAESYKEGLVIVSINSDPKDRWLDFIERKGLTGNQWNELAKGATGLAAVYQVTGIPHYVMISPEGVVLDMWKGYGPGSIKEKVQHWLTNDCITTKDNK